MIYSNRGKNDKKDNKIIIAKKDKNLTFGKTVTQSYYKTINTKNLKKNDNPPTAFNKYVTIGKSIKPKGTNNNNKSVNLSGEGAELDIGSHKSLFEYRADSITKKNPIKKKAQVMSLKSKMMTSKSTLKTNKSCLELSSQNSYEYFKTKKNKNIKKK